MSPPFDVINTAFYVIEINGLLSISGVWRSDDITNISYKYLAKKS